MKNLRHKLLPTQWFGTSKRRQRPQEKQSKQRRLRSEVLEKRELLAGDVLRPDVNPHHNGLAGVDTNADGWVTPSDILVVLNALDQQNSIGGSALGESSSPIEFKVDVNNDDTLTPVDALLIINDLNENGPHAMSELVEFTLDVRDLDDNLIAPGAGGNVEVDVNQIFQLEVGYRDLRGSLTATGVFSQFLNLQTGAGDGSRLVPVLTESQALEFGPELNDNNLSGDYVFSIENSATTFTISRAELVNNLSGGIGDALETFGYDPSEFQVSFSQVAGQFRFDIEYTDFANPEFTNVDLPNISVVGSLTDQSNAAVASTVTFSSLSPRNPDGSINGDAVVDNIDFRSRANSNQELYNFLPNGDFNTTDGFIAVGGVLDGAGSDVQSQLNPSQDTLPNFIDAFSVRVRLESAVTTADPIDVGIEIPTTEEFDEFLLLFREQGRIDNDLVLLDEESMVSIITTDQGVNTPPTVAQALTISVNEDDAATSLNLLTGANDVDGDTLVVINAAATSGNTVGTTVAGNSLNIDPSQYASILNAGDQEVVVFSYTVSDGRGGTVAQTATVTINGLDDANVGPVVSGPISQTFTEDDDPTFVNLLANASDADGDTLSVSNVQLTSGTVAGITIDAANNRINITPQANGALNDGDSLTSTFTYTISDGNGGSVNSSATITVTGITDVQANNPPVFATSPLTVSFSEDDANNVFNLLMGASDADGDTLNVSGFTFIGANTLGVVQSGNSISVTPSSYNFLQANAVQQVVATYSVVDGNGGSPTQTVTVTFNGVNDAPTVAAPLTQTFSESDAATTFNLLMGANDVDTGDVLNVATGAQLTGDTAGVSVSGNALNIDPSAYASLNNGDTATATLTYQITDGNGGSVNQTATITINGEGVVVNNTPPTVAGPLSETFTEDDATQTINLLTGAADVDGDTLSVGSVSISGDVSNGASVNGNTLTITPAAYSALNDGDSAMITVNYVISDGQGGSVNQTATVTISGITDVANIAPVVSAPVTASFNEDDPNGSVNLLANASDADGDTLTAQNVVVSSGDDSGITVNGNTLSVTPSAYGALNAGDVATVVFTYTISDGNGGTVAQTATITIVGEDEANVPGSSLSGQLFIDHINNINDVVNGAAPIRDGIKAANEPGLSGIIVQLTTASGSSRTTTTDLQGNYSFSNVPPGAYTLTYDIPSAVMVTGSLTNTGEVPSTGGATLTGPLLGIVGIQGAISNLDILASSYLTANQEMSAASDGGLQGGSALLDAAGNQELFIAGLGLDGVRFAEITLNANRDAALLTVLEDDGDILTARLSDAQFLVSADGSAVQFFGGVEDFQFADSSEALLTQEFANFRNAIDQVLAQGV